MKYNWNWSVLFEQQYFDWIVSGTLWTIYLSLAASVIAFFLGSLIGILRTLDKKILNFIFGFEGSTFVLIAGLAILFFLFGLAVIFSVAFVYSGLSFENY